MGLDNSLNVSELLRRLGVKGDSLGSAPLLEALRMSVNIADLADLVPPVGVPMGAASLFNTSGVGTFNKWSLICASPGGLVVETLRTVGAGDYAVWVTAVNPFAGPLVAVAHDLAFQQNVLSVFQNFAPAASVQPANTFRITLSQPNIGLTLSNWVGPGEFFNVESSVANVIETMVISWKEYPAGINP